MSKKTIESINIDDQKIAIGNRIREARLNAGYTTQQALADAISESSGKSVTLQTVSLWETGVSMPSTDNLIVLAHVLDVSVNSLIEEHGLLIPQACKKFYGIDNMSKHIFDVANALGNSDTIKALDFAKKAHSGQYRKKSNNTYSNVPYIYHPLNMTCHMLAMGIKDDTILSATLLHDVVEDCDIKLEDLPVGDEAKQLVKLLTHSSDFKHTPKQLQKYFDGIGSNPKASLIKLVDRCNNITSMSWGLPRAKVYRQINETELYVLPLLDKLKRTEYDNAKWLLSYQIQSIIDIYKRLL